MNSRLLVLLLVAAASSARGEILPNPSVIGSATPFNGDYTAGNLFDGNRDSDYASATLGVDTFVDLDFGSPVSMDRFFLMTRANPVDVVGTANLVLSNNADFSSPLRTVVLSPSGSNGAAPIFSFPSTTARYARWDVITSTGSSQNLGGIEMRFLRSRAGSSLVSAAVIGGSAPFSPSYALANAANNDAGRDDSGREYAINGFVTAPTNMFVDFDLGATKSISGFDFFDRMAIEDRTTGFDLLFSNDPSFSSILATRSFATGPNWGYSQTFSPVDARYVRFDATASGGNSGMAEMSFYAVPEPSSALLAGMAGLALTAARRRRR